MEGLEGACGDPRPREAPVWPSREHLAERRLEHTDDGKTTPRTAPAPVRDSSTPKRGLTPSYFVAEASRSSAVARRGSSGRGCAWWRSCCAPRQPLRNPARSISQAADVLTPVGHDGPRVAPAAGRRPARRQNRVGEEGPGANGVGSPASEHHALPRRARTASRASSSGARTPRPSSRARQLGVPDRPTESHERTRRSPRAPRSGSEPLERAWSGSRSRSPRWYAAATPRS